MNLVATRWWSMLFMPSCVLMAAIALVFKSLEDAEETLTSW